MPENYQIHAAIGQGCRHALRAQFLYKKEHILKVIKNIKAHQFVCFKWLTQEGQGK